MGAYRITRRVIPAGGYLEAYAGRASGDRPVVLKHLTQAPSSVERLVENLRVTRGPSLPTVLEIGSGAEGLWVVSEAAEGESLRWVMSTLARAAGFIAPNEGLAVVARVASALDLLHRQQLTHGDICPSTIFLTPRGEVQLHDAGIAPAINPQPDLGPTRSELNALAPEQVAGPSTIETDVFRLGLVLYELAVGRPLWGGTSSSKICHAAAHWHGLTREKVKQVPEPWLTLLVTMLSVQPTARPSMEEVIAVLDQAVEANKWATTDEEIAKLFARASQGRASSLSADPASMQELNLTSLIPPAPPAVVARITTKKMTREMLAVVRTEPSGESPPVPHQPLEVRAALLLVERGKLSRSRLTTAQEAAEALAKDVSSFLIDDGAIDEDSLVAAAGELTKTPSLSQKKLLEASPTAEALALVPLAVSRATQTVPLGLKEGNQLMVAMADPMDPRALDQLKNAIGSRSLIAFRAGPRALAVARSRLYPSHTTSSQPVVPAFDPLALVHATPAPPPPAPSTLSPRVIDALLAMQGLPGMHAQQLISLTLGLAKRLGVSAADQAVLGLATRAMITCALAVGHAPHDVPKLSEVQGRLGFSEADEFIEALHAFPARMPERAAHKALVLAFAFAAHAGEPKPLGSRLGGALSSFRARLQLSQPLFEALSAELV